MTDYVRVKDNETEHEYSITVERYNGDKKLFTKLDKDATAPGGEPLPTKYKVDVASARQKSKEQDAPKVD